MNARRNNRTKEKPKSLDLGNIYYRVKISSRLIWPLVLIAFLLGIYQLSLVGQSVGKIASIDLVEYFPLPSKMQTQIEIEKLQILGKIENAEKKLLLSMRDSEKRDNKANTMPESIDTSLVKTVGAKSVDIQSAQNFAPTPEVDKAKNSGQSNLGNVSKPISRVGADTTTTQQQSLASVGAAIEVNQAITQAQEKSACNECTVLFIGDSLMGDVFFSVQREIKKQKLNWNVVNAHKVSSGLTNTSYYDWPEIALGLVRQHKPDIVILMMGANDAQGMSEGKKAFAFASEDWKKFYKIRADNLVEVVTKQGGQVLWVELPQMKQPGFEKKMSEIRNLQMQAVSSHAQKINGWIATRDILLSAGDPAFDSLRASDGVHLNSRGAQVVALKIISILNGQK